MRDCKAPGGLSFTRMSSSLSAPPAIPIGVHAPRYAARGFTLVEMLASITIFFLVIGILVSGVAQAMRLAAQSETALTSSRDQEIRLGWFRQTVGLSRSGTADEKEHFVGAARSMRGVTSKSLNAESAGRGPFAWEIVSNEASGETELRYSTAAQKGLVVWTWPGREGRFRYLDENNVWREQWPAETLGARSNDPTPPLAVALEFGVPGRMMVVAIQNRAPPPQSLAELFK